MGSACSSTSENSQHRHSGSDHQHQKEQRHTRTPRAPTVHSEEEKTATISGGEGTASTTPTIASSKTPKEGVPPIVIEDGGDVGECSPTISQQHITPTTSSQRTQCFTQNQLNMIQSTGSGYVSVTTSSNNQNQLTPGKGVGACTGDPQQSPASPDPTVVPAQSSGDHSESSSRSPSPTSTPEKKLRRRRNQYPRTQVNRRIGSNRSGSSPTRRSAPHNSPTHNSSHLNIPSHRHPTHHDDNNDDNNNATNAASRELSSHQMVVAFLRRIIGKEISQATSPSRNRQMSSAKTEETDEILRNSLPSFSDAQQLAEVIIQISAYERDVREEHDKHHPQHKEQHIIKHSATSSSAGTRPATIDTSSTAAAHHRSARRQLGTPSQHPNAVQDKSWSPTFLANSAYDDNDPSSLSLSTSSDSEELSSSYDGSVFRGDGAELGIVGRSFSSIRSGSLSQRRESAIQSGGFIVGGGAVMIETSESEDVTLSAQQSAGVLIPTSPTHGHISHSKPSSSHLGGTYNSTVTIESAASSYNHAHSKHQNTDRHRRHHTSRHRGTHGTSIPISKCEVSVLETTAAATTLVARDRRRRRQSAAIHASMLRSSGGGGAPHVVGPSSMKRASIHLHSVSDGAGSFFNSHVSEGDDRRTPTHTPLQPIRMDSTSTLSPAAPLSYFTSKNTSNKMGGMVNNDDAMIDFGGAISGATTSTAQSSISERKADGWGKDSSTLTASSGSGQAASTSTTHNRHHPTFNGAGQQLDGSQQQTRMPPHNGDASYSTSLAMFSGSPSNGSPQSLQLLTSEVAFLATKPFVNLESMGELETTSPGGVDAIDSSTLRHTTNKQKQSPKIIDISPNNNTRRGTVAANSSATLFVSNSHETGSPSLDSCASGPRPRDVSHTGACQQWDSFVGAKSHEILPSTSSSSLPRRRIPTNEMLMGTTQEGIKNKGDGAWEATAPGAKASLTGAGSPATTATPLTDGSVGTGDLTVFRSNCAFLTSADKQQNDDVLATVPSSAGVVVSNMKTTTTSHTQHGRRHTRDFSHHLDFSHHRDDAELDNYSDSVVVLEVLRQLLRGNMGMVSTPLDFHDAIKPSIGSFHSNVTEDTPDSAQQLPSFVAVASSNNPISRGPQHHRQLYPPPTTNIHVLNHARHHPNDVTALDRTIPSMISSSGSSSEPASVRQPFAATLQGRSSTLPIASIPADDGGESDGTPPNNDSSNNESSCSQHSTTGIQPKGSSSSAVLRVTSGEEFGSTIRSQPGGVSIGSMSPLGSFSHHLRANRGPHPHTCTSTDSLHSFTQVPPSQHQHSSGVVASDSSAHHLLATYTPVGSAMYLTRQAPSPIRVATTRSSPAILPEGVDTKSNPVGGSDDQSPPLSNSSDPSAIESYASMFTSPSSPIAHSQHSTGATVYSSMVMYPSAQLSAPLLISQSGSSCGGRSGPLSHDSDPHSPHEHGAPSNQVEGGNTSLLSVQWSSIAKMEVRQRLLFNDSILSDTKDDDCGVGVSGRGGISTGGGTRHLVIVQRPGRMKTDPTSQMCVVLPRVFMDVEVYAAIASSSSSHNPDGAVKNRPLSDTPPTKSATNTTTAASLNSPPCIFARGGGIERIAANSLSREERRVLHSYIRKALRCLRPAALKIVCSLVVDSIGVIKALHESALQQSTGAVVGLPRLVPQALLLPATSLRKNSTASDSPSPPTSPQQLLGESGTQHPPSPSPPQAPRPQLPFYISMTGRRVPLPPGVTAADVLRQQSHIRAGSSPRACAEGGGGGGRVGAGYPPVKGGFRRGSRDRTGGGNSGGGGGDISPSYGSAAHSFFTNDSINHGILKARVGSRGKGYIQSASSRHTPASSSLIYSPSSRSEQQILSITGNGEGDTSVIIDDGVDWLTSAQFGGQHSMTPRGRSTGSNSVSPSNSLHTSTNRAGAPVSSKHHHRLPAPPSRTPSPTSRKLTNTTITDGGGGRTHKPFADISTTESNSISLSGSVSVNATTARGGDVGACISAAAAAHSGNTIYSIGPAGSGSVGKQTFGTPLTTVVTTSTSLSSYGHNSGAGGGEGVGGALLSESGTPTGSSAEHVLKPTTRGVLGSSGNGGMSGSLQLSGLQNVVSEGAFSSASVHSNSRRQPHHPHMPPTQSPSSTNRCGVRAGSISDSVIQSTPEVRGGLPGVGGNGCEEGPLPHIVPNARLMVIEGVDIANVMSPDSRSMHVTPMATSLDMNSQYNSNNTGRHLFNNSNSNNTHTATSTHQLGYINPLAGRSTSNSISSHPASRIGSNGGRGGAIEPRCRQESPRGVGRRNSSVDSSDADGPVLTSVHSNVSSVHHTSSLLDNFSAAMVLKSAPSNSSLRTSSVRLPAPESRVGSQAHMLGGEEKDHYLSPKTSGVRLLARRPQTQDSGSRSRLQHNNNSSSSPQRGDSQRSMSLVQPLPVTSGSGDKAQGGGGNASPALFPSILPQSSSSARVSGGPSKRLER